MGMPHLRTANSSFRWWYHLTSRVGNIILFGSQYFSDRIEMNWLLPASVTRRFCVTVGAILGSVLLVVGARGGEAVPLEGEVRLVFKTHCLHCHGEASVLEADLDLRLARLMIDAGVVEPGDAGESHLFDRMTDGSMPPAEVAIRPTEEEIDLVRRWIDGGATTARPEPEDPEALPPISPEERAHWAFQPIRRAAVPRGSDDIHNPIDAFIERRLGDQGRSLSPLADPHALLRRITFDLTGLPPTPLQIDAFAADPSLAAYEKAVDRLLASESYGVRWARHWLDVVGYADSEGFDETDRTRPLAYKYRDYVIDSFNRDLPWDQFITEQLAGDELVTSPMDDLTAEDQRRLVATGFLRMAPDGTGSATDDADAATNAMVAETIKIVSSSLMALTVGCAQCHDHRYDPILHKDYYRLRAVLAPAMNWQDWKTPQQRTIQLSTKKSRRLAEEVRRRAEPVREQFDAKEAAAIEVVFNRELGKLPEALRHPAETAYRTPDSERSDDQRQLLADHPNLNVSGGGALMLYLELFPEGIKLKEELEAIKKRIGKIESEAPPQDGIRALTEPPAAPDSLPKTFVFHRGDPTQPTDEVGPGDLSVLSDWIEVDIAADDPNRPTSGRRLALAERLTDPNHPLTARVLVNRVWMHHFGRGIVSTPGDFGTQGQRPTHPELLDRLARSLIDGGWSVKSLHKTMVMSRTYRQSSRRDDSGWDPENQFYGRQTVRRLEAETIRDAMLAVSGQLSSRGGGPATEVRRTSQGETVVSDDLDPTRSSQRSIFVQNRRSTPLAMLQAFDAPDLEPNCTQRVCSTVTPQSLLLMNSEVLIRQSEAFADRLLRELPAPTARDDDRIARAWRLAYGDRPEPAELALSLQFLANQTRVFEDQPLEEDDAEPSTLALRSFCQTLLGSNEFLYVD